MKETSKMEICWHPMGSRLSIFSLSLFLSSHSLSQAEFLFLFLLPLRLVVSPFFPSLLLFFPSFLCTSLFLPVSSSHWASCESTQISWSCSCRVSLGRTITRPWQTNETRKEKKENYSKRQVYIHPTLIWEMAFVLSLVLFSRPLCFPTPRSHLPPLLYCSIISSPSTLFLSFFLLSFISCPSSPSVWLSSISGVNTAEEWQRRSMNRRPNEAEKKTAISSLSLYLSVSVSSSLFFLSLSLSSSWGHRQRGERSTSHRSSFTPFDSHTERSKEDAQTEVR